MLQVASTLQAIPTIVIRTLFEEKTILLIDDGDCMREFRVKISKTEADFFSTIKGNLGSPSIMYVGKVERKARRLFWTGIENG